MLHRKKLLALALATAAGVPALVQAQTGNVVLYGKLYPEMVWAHGTGGTSPGTPVSIASLASRADDGSTIPAIIYGLSRGEFALGVRGQEKISCRCHGDLPDRADHPGRRRRRHARQPRHVRRAEERRTGARSSSATSTPCTRTSATPCRSWAFRAATSCRTATSCPRRRSAASSAGSFHLRRANSVQYESPDFGLRVSGAVLARRGEDDLAQRRPDLHRRAVREWAVLRRDRLRAA